MTPIASPTTFLRNHGREVALWTVGVVASALLVFGVYTTAGKPFSTTLGDPLALPKELVVTSGNATIPLPPELAETLAAAPSQAAAEDMAIPAPPVTQAPERAQLSATTQNDRSKVQNTANNDAVRNVNNTTPTTSTPTTAPPATQPPETDPPAPTTTPPSTWVPQKNTAPNNRASVSDVAKEIVDAVSGVSR